MSKGGWTAVILGFWAAVASAAADQETPIRVLVWDEQQIQQKSVYEDFLGNAVVRRLNRSADLSARSALLADPEQGLTKAALDATDVLVWWGHVRQAEVKPETGRALVERIKRGRLSLIALHSAHWSTPFVEAMKERTRELAEKKRSELAAAGERVEVEYIAPARRYVTPTRETLLTPSMESRRFPDGRTILRVREPICCFPAYRADGKPSFVKVLKPDHPIARGLAKTFMIAQTEMYDEPFHVPEPDEVLLEERWAAGEWFRSGCLWNLGAGKVFYFRPGHEIYPVYKQEAPLQIVENAVRFLGRELRASGRKTAAKN